MYSAKVEVGEDPSLSGSAGGRSAEIRADDKTGERGFA
jgi:hypothetical protein